ncbi:MAG: DNA polymerase/3'-5' exonuclease PolX, partial [Acidobacteria bacterium]|nr:DNA polymerase/3'-5' exonuclease PolX [Acidobacteriota bacterium]
YKQAASAIRALDEPVTGLVQPDGTLRRIRGIGPASTRVILEVLRTGTSPTVERAVAESRQIEEVGKRRAWRRHFLSRARVRAVLEDSALAGPRASDYRGDLQMHSTWSDGSQTLDDIVATGTSLGYAYAAVTDHSAGLPIARGVSRERFAEQRAEIDRVNRVHAGRFRLLKGVEANIRGDGEVDVDAADRRQFDLVVAAPHSGLRSSLPQTERMLAAVMSPGVHILGHPRGRMYGSRPGVSADWARVFEAAARTGVAIEIDGDPSRQDLDYVLAQQALDAGCLFALDSDAHAVGQWRYADTALAHARLAGVPRDRVINCWTLDRLLEWARGRSS